MGRLLSARRIALPIRIHPFRSVQLSLDLSNPYCSFAHQRQPFQRGHRGVCSILAQAAVMVGETGFEEDA
jgi:hypothetical protein